MSSLLGMNGGADFDLTPGLVSHYLLNNNADDSFGINDATAIGGVDFQGDTASFDGSSGYTVASVDHSILTLSFWTNNPIVEDPAHRAYFFGSGTAIPDARIISTGSWTNKMDNETLFLAKDTSTDIYSYIKDVFDNDEWKHITIIFDGLHRVFVNGIERTVYHYGNVFNAINQLTEMGRGFWAGNPLYGTQFNMSNVRFYTDGKDQEFINALYAEGYYPKPLPLPTTDGLIAHYPLTGTAEDATGSHDGTEVGNTYVNDGEFGSVASFDGTNDFIDLSTNASSFELNNYTFSSMVYIDSLTLPFTIFTTFYYDTTMPYFGFVFRVNSDNTLQVAHLYNSGWSAEDQTQSTTTLDLGKWYHVTATYDGTTCKLYLNGAFIYSKVLPNISWHSTNKVAYIGKRLAGTTNYSDGKQTNTRIYNTALTQQKITDIYNYEKNFRPIDIDNGLVAYYPLAKNSLDNYYNEYDGVDDVGVTYDGVKATLLAGQSISFPSAIGFVEAYYWKNGLFLTTTTESDLNNVTNLVRNGTFDTDLADWNTSSHWYWLNGTAYSPATSSWLGLYQDIPFEAGVTYTVNVSVDRVSGTLEVGILNSVSGQIAELAEISSDGNYSFQYTATADAVRLCFNRKFGTTWRGTVDNVEVLAKSTSTTTLSKIRKYNKALTAEQVEIIYNTEKGDFA